MKLTDMKRTVKERKKRKSVEVATNDEKYPYGLRLNLENDALKKLGLDISDLAIDQKVNLICRAEVVSLSTYKSSGEKDSESLSLQITHLSFGGKNTINGLKGHLRS